MAKGKGGIGLTIAERRKPTKESFDYRNANVEKWVETLPVGNIGETARQVYNALHEVNRLAIPWKERQRFLERLGRPVGYVQSSLIKRFSNIPFPLPPKAQRIVTLSQSLYLEMALGYKTAVEEMLGSSILTRDNRALTELMHRAMRYISQAILTAYRTYAPHPPHAWFELHVLFRHAEHRNLHQTPVRDPFNETMPESSIARAYKQILLLALASPYRLRQGEAEQIYAALARWAGHAHIHPYNTPEADEALFVVHMDSDDAPDYQAFNHRDCNTELCRLVDTRQLSHVLREELKFLAAEKKRSIIAPDLMQRLIRSWAVAPKRSFNRSEREAQIEVVVGSSMLHQALAHMRGDERRYDKRASYESKTVTDINRTDGDDVWDILSSNKIQRGYEQFEQQQQPPPANSEPEFVIQQWLIRNESAGGYRLAMPQAHQTRIQVGELLGLRNPQGNGQWEIGVVRWIRQTGDGGLEIGVQILAPEALPVTLRNVRLADKASNYQSALLLPDIPAIGQPASLITPIMLFSPGNEVHLHMPGKEVRVVLLERMQDSGSFVQFRFAGKTGPTQKPSEKKSEITQPDHGFGDIWREL